MRDVSGGEKEKVLALQAAAGIKENDAGTEGDSTRHFCSGLA